MRAAYPPRDSGMVLIAALFAIVILGALGLFAMSLGQSHQGIVDLELLSRRAAVAANMGVEWAAIRTTTTGSCDLVQPTRLAPNAALSGFSVDVWCIRRSHPEGFSYQISSVATSGVYGSATFVRRTVNVRLPT